MEQELMKEELPHWVTKRGNLLEAEFADWFCKRYYIVYQDGAFFSPEGRITNEHLLKKQIYEEIRPYIFTGIAAKVDNILSTLKYHASQDCLKEDPEVDLVTVHVANGSYSLVHGFSPMKHLCRYRSYKNVPR